MPTRALYAYSLRTQAIHPILYATVAGITVNLPKFFSELAIPRQLGFSVRCHAMPCQAVPDSPYCIDRAQSHSAILSCGVPTQHRGVCAALRCAAVGSVDRLGHYASTEPT